VVCGRSAKSVLRARGTKERQAVWVGRQVQYSADGAGPAETSSYHDLGIMASVQFFFLNLIEGLKTTLRRGWVLRDVPDPESVSDHMYRMAIVCLEKLLRR
jgi:hypothetical protein